MLEQPTESKEVFRLDSGFCLREIVEEDLDNIFSGLSNPEVFQYYGVRFLDREACREQMKFYKDLTDKKQGHWWAIVDETKQFAGAIGLNDRNAEEKTIEIGFWLLPAYWGKGIITSCIPFVKAYAFEKCKSLTLLAFVESENVACLKLLKKNKFKLQTVLNKAEWKEGKWINLHVFSLDSVTKDMGKNTDKSA